MNVRARRRDVNALTYLQALQIEKAQQFLPLATKMADRISEEKTWRTHKKMKDFFSLQSHVSVFALGFGTILWHK